MIEEGLNGRTSAFDDPQLPGRNGLSYLLPCLLTHMPIHTVVLMLGTNDCKSRFNLNAEQITVGLSKLIEVINAADCGEKKSPPKILLVSPSRIYERYADQVFFGGEQKSVNLDRCYQQLANQLGCSFVSANTAVQTSNIDGVHWTENDHFRFANMISDFINSHFIN